MTKLDITVMFTGSIPSRIYLALLNKNGYQAKNIVLLDWNPTNKSKPIDG